VSTSLAALIGRRFIQRRDVKAIQFDNGDYVPDLKMKDSTRHGLGFKMSHLQAHLDGRETYGHYLIGNDNKCRMFALDIDLETSGSYVEMPDFSSAPTDPDEAEIWAKENTVVYGVTADQVKEQPGLWGPRDWWHDRRNASARAWYKMQMKAIAGHFAAIVTKDLQLPCAVAYSGNKGVHVYGFLGEAESKECREAALLTLELSGEWDIARGKNFYKHKNQDPVMGYPSFSVETFPKQEDLDGKKLGNLMRLPLGVNRKHPKDPTFFLDMTGPLAEFKPHADPVQLLESGDPFQ
jgi:hypothetical protein